MTIIEGIAGLMIHTFILMQIVQQLEIYTDEKSIKKMFKQFMVSWAALSMCEICIFLIAVKLAMLSQMN